MRLTVLPNLLRCEQATMPTLPQQPEIDTHKSLQININSEDDAKAVIQHLQLVKKTWDTMHDSGLVDSIEFCIAEAIRRKVDGPLMGAIRWCRTYTKSVAPFAGNVFFAVPHLVAYPNSRPPKPEQPEQVPVPAGAPVKVNRYLRNLPPLPSETVQPASKSAA